MCMTEDPGIDDHRLRKAALRGQVADCDRDPSLVGQLRFELEAIRDLPPRPTRPLEAATHSKR